MKHLLLAFSIFLTALTTQAQMGIGTATPNAAAQLDVTSTTKGFLAPRMTKTERDAIATVSSASKGLLIYQTDNTPGFYYYDGTAWTSLAGSSSASGVDLTTAQSVGGLKTFISNDGLLAKGTLGSGVVSSLGAGTRMMWYPRKAAFRAGYIDGTQWDDANIGTYSTAMGRSSIASGAYSTAMGRSTTASGISSAALGVSTTASGLYSTAMGGYTISSGDYSTAMGNTDTASGKYSTAMGSETNAIGDYSIAMGSGNTSRSYGETAIGLFNTDYTANLTSDFNAADRLFVIGNGMSFDAKSDALLMLKNGNTTFGGSLAINGNGAGTSYTFPTGRGTANYVLTTDGAGATSWAAAGTPGVDLTTNQTVGGLKTFTSDDGLLAIGTYGSGTASTLGAGTRMMWYPKKAAFRAGASGVTTWDDVNIGIYSAAMGSATIASGAYSSAFGQNNQASGVNSTALGALTTSSGSKSMAMGYSTTANATSSTAMGDRTRALASYATSMGSSTTASGEASTSMGKVTTAKSFAETVIGTYNTDYLVSSTSAFSTTDRLFVIGNGTSSSALSDALVMLKNGNTTFGGSLAVNGNGTGTSYTLPTGRGTANYVLTTDGVGATSWAATASTGVDLTTAQSVGGLKTFTSDDGLLAKGTLGFGAVSSLGAGTRMMWYPIKAAFRAGQVDGANWDDVNIGESSIALGRNNKAKGFAAVALGSYSNATGDGSVALGESTIASGQTSTALGSSTTASGYAATTLGSSTTASGDISTAMGYSTIASGQGSTVMGYFTKARSYGETVIGMRNTDYIPSMVTEDDNYSPDDRLFVIGNGFLGPASDALVMLKNGNTTFSGTVTGVSFTSTSDLRLKKNIEPLKNSIEAIMQLNPVSYEKKNSLASTEYNITENGFIAQELQKVMPSLVVMGTDKDKLLSVNYTAIIPMLTKAIQEQQNAIQDQKKENLIQQKAIQEQKNAIQDQQNQISELKKMVELLMKK